MTENFLKYENSFTASMSDLWWDRVLNNSFGACIENFMDNRYTFKNGISIFVSETTMHSVYKYALQSQKPTLARYQALLDCLQFEKSHTGENVGNWLHEMHKGVRHKMDFIGSHVVDGAYNAGKYIEVIEWKTQGERPQNIVTAK